MICALGMLIMLGACASSGNGGAGSGNGFVTTTGGQVWKNAFGECWGHSGRSADSSHPECGGAAPAPVMEEEPYVPNDEDKDGVSDVNDFCPWTPEGIKVDSRGCALDADNDGVPDHLDECPGTPAGNTVNSVGCTIKIVSLSGVHFAFDSATLTSEAKSILDNAAQIINARSDTRFAIEGHTDSSGPDNYNQSLSERRANSVLNYLVSKGVSASSLSAVGKGESSPVTSNDTREGRAKNRRVDVLAR